MKITLDHNCIIAVENKTTVGIKVHVIVSDAANECFIVNIGASEMRKYGVLPDHYEKFEKLLRATGLAHLVRLDPMAIYDVTFWDHCVYADDEMEKLSRKIEEILFPSAAVVDLSKVGLDSANGRKWLNRVCDVQTMWCHIRNQNDVFLTTDRNFSKETKRLKLAAMGAGRICHPDEI